MQYVTEEDFQNYRRQRLFKINFLNQRSNLFEKIDLQINQANPWLNKLFGNKLVLKLICPLIMIFVFAMIVAGPYLAGFKYGLLLGLMIFIAYGFRWLYGLGFAFRTKLLEELERILITIRNNLSTGQSLDYAIYQATLMPSIQPIHQSLVTFIKTNNTNLISSFPDWLKSLENLYRIPDLSMLSQLLTLELKYNHNQEEAFINISNCLSQKQKQNKKQKNTISITFLTLDFMVLAFLAVIFLVIPNLSFSSEINWWQSERRYFIVFISGFVIWAAYAATIFLSFWRTK